MSLSHTRILYLFLLIGLISACKSTEVVIEEDVERNWVDRESMPQPEPEPDPSEWVYTVYNPSHTRVNDLLHTKLEVSFDWDNQYLNGKATLDFKPYFYPTSTLRLDAKGFDIHELALMDSKGGKTPLEYDYSDTMQLFIELPREYTRDEKYTIFIDYTAKPNELPQGGSSAITGDKGLYFINPDGSDPNKPRQLWTQGETEASSCWFPTIDRPNEKTTQEIYMTVEDQMVTLSNGNMVSSKKNSDGTRTDYWKMDLAHTPYLFMMFVGDYAIVKDTWEGIPVDYYVAEDYEPYAKDIFGNTPEMLTFYSDILGVKYPWAKYSQVVVTDFVSGAMENTTATIHFDGLHRTDRELLDETYEDIVAHELIHHWFGDLVTCESWANIPLNESFATYGEYLWIEYKYGRAEADHHLNADLDAYLNESSSKQEDMIRFDYDDKEDMFDAHSYQKGGRILHMLRNYIGDDAFFASLKLYLEENQYEPVEMHQLRLAVEEITGEDMNWFFNQWFFASGHPYLYIDFEVDEETGDVWMFSEQAQDFTTTPLYKLPVEIDFYVGTEVIRETVWIDSIFDYAHFKFDAAPELINFDAENVLLCEKQVFLPDDFMYITMAELAPLYFDRKEAVEILGDLQWENVDFRSALVSAMTDEFWAIRSEAIRSIDVMEEDEDYAIIRDILIDLAKNDEKSDVRSDAIDKLVEMGEESVSGLFEEIAMNDQSYMVVGSALTGLIELDGTNALKIAASLEDESNLSVVNAVGKTYAEHGGPEKQTYYESKLESESGFTAYLLMNSYGVFLGNNIGRIDGSDAIQSLSSKGKDASEWWVTFAASNALNKYKRALEDKSYELEEEISELEGSTGSRLTLAKEELAEIEDLIDEVNDAVDAMYE